ncbi:MAG TPA: HmsD [Pasteurellaceae bacterium]|nr:HmsD [Pasteurellaceae bacterium]
MELQKLMIIQKQAKELPLALILKSMLISLLTWSLWGYSLYVIAEYSQDLFEMPIFEHYFFHEIITLMFMGAVALLGVTITWSFIAKPSSKKPLMLGNNYS